MRHHSHIQDELVKAISDISSGGATILEIEKKVRFERHTLSKYLSLLEADGLVYHRPIGKAKVWFINKAPLKTVLQSHPLEQTFTEKILSALISNMPLGMAVIDTQFTVLFTNQKMTDTYGTIQGTFFYDSVLGLKNPLKLRKIQEIFDSKKTAVQIVVLDKNEASLQITASKLTNPDSTFSLILLIEDITQKIKAQEQVYQQKILLEAEREALNKAAIVAETDLMGLITYVNDKFVEISGYQKKELLGKTHRIINSSHHPTVFWKKMWDTVARGEIWHGLIKNRAKNGSYYWVESTIAPVLGKDGKPVKYLAIRFDVTKYMNKIIQLKK